MLSFLEIDEQGNVNVHHLPGRRHVTPGYAAWSAGCLVVLGRPTRRRGVGQRGPRDHPGPNVTVRQNAAIPYRWLAHRAELVELSLVTRDTDPEPLVQQFLQITANSAAHLTSAGHGT